MNFKRSSRKSWNLMRKLGEAANPVKIDINMNPEKISSKIKQNSKKGRGNMTIHRQIKTKFRRIKSSLQENPELEHPFTIDELNIAIGVTKIGKAAGLDGIYPEFIKHLGKRARIWLLKFCNIMFKTSNLPPLILRANIVAILKHGKDPVLPESYRPIALLSVIYKLLEKLIIGF